MTGTIDFTNCRKILGRAYNGANGKKIAVEPSLLMQHFWNVFVVDALLGNFDRHNGNWGFLYDDSAKEASLAPIYDCGSCLLPQANKRIMAENLL